MNILIVSHLDPDGIFSAHMLKTRYLSSGSHQVKVIFSNWHSFGIPEDVSFLKIFEEADEIFVIDLGTELEQILLENGWAEEGKKVIHIDHHPTNLVFLDKRKILSPRLPGGFIISENLDINWSPQNCAAGITYLKLVEMAKEGKFGYGGVDTKDLPLLSWLPVWAFLGIHADVAVSTEGGQEVISSLREYFPSLSCDWFQESMKGFEDLGGEVRVPLPSLIGRFFNVPRKVVFDKGPILALKACEEIDQLRDFSVLLREDPSLDVEAPSAALLRNFDTIFTKEVFRIIKEEDYHLYDFTTHGYVFLKHRWNLGADIARLLSRRYSKGMIGINFGLQEIELGNGRNPQKAPVKWDLGKVFSSVRLFNDAPCLSGGGHPNAAAISFEKGTPPLAVLNMIEAEFRKIEPRRGA